MVYTEQVQHCGVQIVDRYRVLNRVVAVFIGGAVDSSTFNTAARHPYGKSERIMVAAVAPLCHWCSPKLAGPYDKRALQQAPALQIF